MVRQFDGEVEMNRILHKRTPFIAVLASLLWVTVAQAADEDVATPTDEAAKLVEQVTRNDGAIHRQATDKLIKIGLPAVASLVKAAETDNVVAVTRCFDALGRLLVCDDEKTAKATQEALEKLSDSAIRIVAVRAKTTLIVKEFQKQQRPPQLLGVPNAAPLPGFPPQGLRFNGGLGGVGGQTRQIRITNGKRQIESQDGDEKVLINDTNGQDIVLKHTRTVDGKEKTDEYKGPDLDDLKKKHPEAAKLYEKHAGNNLNIRGGAGAAVQIQIGVAAGAPAIRGQLRGPDPFGPDSVPNQPGGPRTIRSEQGGRKIEITDEDGKKIRVKMTKVVDGKDVSQEFSADDLKSLKSEHPDAAKLYEQLTGRKAE